MIMLSASSFSVPFCMIMDHLDQSFVLPGYSFSLFFFFNDPPTTEIYTLSLHAPFPILIFQDPLTSLHPMLSIGRQLTEHVRLPLGLGRREAERHAPASPADVRIPDPASAPAEP